jgi:transposase-like protein
VSTKKTYTATFKAQVVLELLKEDQTISQLASKYGVHPSLLRDWKTVALNALPTAFERRDTRAASEAAHTQQLEELYAEIGRLTTQLNWLKKKLGS